MKRLELAIVTVLIAFGLAPAATADAAFTKPQPGETIQTRARFDVIVEIPNKEAKSKHWVAIATVTGHGDTWDEVRELREAFVASKSDDDRKKMLGLLADWEPLLLWPKFYVKESPMVGTVFDGGTNPMEGLVPVPMLLLLLEVDDTFHGYFQNWFTTGAERGFFEGIPADKLRPGMIIADCAIFFP